MKNTAPKFTGFLTHSGIFHADEVTSFAIYCLNSGTEPEKENLVRTREPKMINSFKKKGYFISDVGGILDLQNGQVDHHGTAKIETEKIAIMLGREYYASAGLTWLIFGHDICHGNQKLWKNIDRLVKKVDEVDCFGGGITSLLGNLISDFRPVVYRAHKKTAHGRFREASRFVYDIISRKIENERTRLSCIVTQAVAITKTCEQGFMAMTPGPIQSIEVDKSHPQVIKFNNRYPKYDIPKTVSLTASG